MFDRTSIDAVMPNGRIFEKNKSRWEGTLDKEEMSFCRANDIAIAFDPVQQGWVMLDAEDGSAAAHPAISNDEIKGDTRENVTPDPTYTFRPWDLQDLESYQALLDDPAVWKYLPEAYPDPLDEDTARVLIEISNTGTHHDVCAIVRDGEIVGQARLAFPIKVRDFDVAEISYWLGREHWGKGFGSDVVRLFTERSFEKHASLREIFASVHIDNLASARALEKAGYAYRERKSGDPQLKILRIDRSGALASRGIKGNFTKVSDDQRPMR